MPVEPAPLTKYSFPPSPRPQRREGVTGAVIAVPGSLAVVAAFLVCRSSAFGAGAFVAATIGFATLLTLALAVVGWRESGVVGVLYRLRHPMGTMLAGDDRPAWSWFALAWLLVLSSVLSGVLLVRHPGAWPLHSAGPTGVVPGGAAPRGP